MRAVASRYCLQTPIGYYGRHANGLRGWSWSFPVSAFLDSSLTAAQSIEP